MTLMLPTNGFIDYSPYAAAQMVAFPANTLTTPATLPVQSWLPADIINDQLSAKGQAPGLMLRPIIGDKGIVFPQKVITVSGAAMAASFKPSNPNKKGGIDYYWVQYYKETTTTKDGANEAKTVKGNWYVDGVDLGIKQMPYAYYPTPDASFFDAPNQPISRLGDCIFGKPVRFSLLGATINFLNVPLAASPNAASVSIKEQAEIFKKNMYQYVYTAEFELYLVKVGQKEPLGYISWGYTYTAPNQITIIPAKWNKGKDGTVWNVAQYPPSRR
jgi:hypothetical protein